MIYNINKKALLQEMDTDALDDYMKDSAEQKEATSSVMRNVTKYGAPALGTIVVGTAAANMMGGAKDAKNSFDKVNTLSTQYGATQKKSPIVAKKEAFTKTASSKPKAMNKMSINAGRK